MFLVPGLNPYSTEKLQDISYLHKKTPAITVVEVHFSRIFKSARNLI